MGGGGGQTEGKGVVGGGGLNFGASSTLHDIAQNPRGGKTQPRGGGGMVGESLPALKETLPSDFHGDL